MRQDIKLRNVGNSTVVALPKAVLEKSFTKVGDVMEIRNFGDYGFIITPKPAKKKLRGEYLMEDYYGKPIEQIGMIDDRGDVWKDIEPVGKEVW